MAFAMDIQTDNAAFEEPGPEIARILRAIADEVENGNEYADIHDTNGNTVGRWLLGDAEETA